MSALEKREKYQVVCYGKTNNYWFTDEKEEAESIFDMGLKYLRKKYFKIIICEDQAGCYETLNEVCAIGTKKSAKK